MIFKKIAIIGTVGLPSNYGGFETLAENLVRYHQITKSSVAITVYCSGPAYSHQPRRFLSASLRYVPLKANGAQSILYDIWSLLSATRKKTDVILVLGVSGALVFPLVRAISRAKIVTNIDGIEWKREKWRGFGKHFLRMSELIAVRCSHSVIADNQAIADYISDTYGISSKVITYGGNHAIEVKPNPVVCANLPETYALSLCRIEPENNVAMILESWTKLDRELVFVGNWNNSDYGQKLRARFSNFEHIHLLDPIYEPSALRAIRDRANLYVHGHSAGGTNPSLVEMMHFGIPVLSHSCAFNRYTTEERALYFESAVELRAAVLNLNLNNGLEIGRAMQEIARRRYTWAKVGEAYFRLLEG